MVFNKSVDCSATLLLLTEIKGNFPGSEKWDLYPQVPRDHPNGETGDRTCKLSKQLKQKIDYYR